MKDFMNRCWIRAQIAKSAAREKTDALRRELLSEEGGADTIIIAIIIIVIVVSLGVIFREQIGKWISALFGQVDIENNDFSVTTAAT